MHQCYIRSCDHPLYEAFRALYRTAFPIFEQRSETQQVEAFENPRYRLLCFEEDGGLLGFIAYWEFDTYCYVEHFAVDADRRGKGHGSRLLRTFMETTGKMVLLEIDPVVDSVSEARLRFYKRCGFCENPYPHKHPAYNAAYPPHPLVVVTTRREITPAEYQQFLHDLTVTVMRQTP